MWDGEMDDKVPSLKVLVIAEVYMDKETWQSLVMKRKNNG